jgi:CheY-like chemotaxis protein
MIRPRHGHVLVVEGSDEDFETVLDASRLANVINEIRRATSGDECLQHLAELEGKKLALPILVLLDLNTPKGDGRDALRGIIRNERFRAMPLVVISASANSRDVSFCYNHGANAYHLKPVSHPQHLQILQNIFSYWLTCAMLPGPEGSNRS